MALARWLLHQDLVIGPIHTIDSQARIGTHVFTIRDPRPRIRLAAAAAFHDDSNPNQRHQNCRCPAHVLGSNIPVLLLTGSIMTENPGDKSGLPLEDFSIGVQRCAGAAERVTCGEEVLRSSHA